MPDELPAAEDVIVCPLMPWYSRLNHRFSGLGGMFIVFGVWFLIDGLWRWPQENAQALQRQAFIKQIDDAKASGGLADWVAKAKSQGLRVPEGIDLASETVSNTLWASHAAQRGWPEKPKQRPQEELDQQVQLSAFMFVAVAALAIYLFAVRNRKLIGHSDHLIAPNGERVNFADAFRVDKRKWDKQGLAYVFHRQGEGGSERKVAIDDLQYDGAGKVLERLLANFHGELIEKVAEPEEAADGSVSGKNADS